MDTSTALLLIDIQVGLDEPNFYGTERNNLQAEANCKRLLDHYREKNYCRVFIQHDSTNPASPLYPGKPGHAIKPEVAPLEDELVLNKNVNSAFIGTNLAQWLQAQGMTSVIIAGLTIEHCISSSVRMAANLGFEVTLVSDATAAFDKVSPDGTPFSAEQVHQIELACLSGEFATIMTTAEVLQLLQ